MRGEHLDTSMLLFSQQGSSPHARGTLNVCLGLIMVDGIIPACAGNTYVTMTKTADLRDHPRMRGEHDWSGVSGLSSSGSSPHARGTPVDHGFRIRAHGIIPACAGNTDGCDCPLSSVGDHPRMRGEHRLDKENESCQTGSSPHARGTRSRGRVRRVHPGIIPACAGNTRCGSCGHDGYRDHPRMRGEH